MGDALAQIVAVALGATWYGVDYRLAPEHPAPAAVEDVAALLGALPGAVALGDSAGAGALVAALGSGASAAALVMVCPWLDLTASHPDPGEPPLTGAWLARCARLYAPEDRAGAIASPGRHPWHVTAPTLVVSAGLDPLVGDTRALVNAPGVEVREWRAALHDFALLAGSDPDADDAAGVIVDFLSDATGWTRIDSAVTG
ncbi:MAG TPA: alpha/beta hydrolase fold domain-containing protein, partial [Acidimicrobiales bacterium]|nr:alpha/beta hydrolase fold domain-containing protein [Acidimicrobiales bacterium]